MNQHKHDIVTVDAVRGAVLAANETVALACGMELCRSDIGITRQNNDLIVVMRFRGESHHRQADIECPISVPRAQQRTTRGKGNGLLAFFPSLQAQSQEKP